MIRGKKRIDPVALNKGYDSGSDSYMIPVGFSKDYTAALAKENLFRRYGTVVKAPTQDGYIQTVVLLLTQKSQQKIWHSRKTVIPSIKFHSVPIKFRMDNE